MTSQDVFDLNEYWSAHPPVNEVAMIGFGVEVKKRRVAITPNSSSTTGNILPPEELLRMVNVLNGR